MPSQSRFLCIGGFLNGTQVKDQGESFVCVENGKQVVYRKQVIFHQEAWDHDYYICENVTDQQEKEWVFQKYGETVIYRKRKSMKKPRNVEN